MSLYQVSDQSNGEQWTVYPAGSFRGFSCYFQVHTAKTMQVLYCVLLYL